MYYEAGDFIETADSETLELIASNVQLYTGSHPVPAQECLIPDWKGRRTTFFRSFARPIEIKDNVWIGGGSILLPA